MSKLKQEYREPFKRLAVCYSNHALARAIYGKDNRESCLSINRAMEGKAVYPRLLGPITTWIETQLKAQADKQPAPTANEPTANRETSSG